jgi:MFS family permease
MILGRGIFGVGAEFSYIIVPILLTQWFLGKELSFSYGVGNNFPYLVGVVSGQIIVNFCKSSGLSQTFALGASVCIFSLLISFWLTNLNNKVFSDESEVDSS